MFEKNSIGDFKKRLPFKRFFVVVLLLLLLIKSLSIQFAFFDKNWQKNYLITN